MHQQTDHKTRQNLNPDKINFADIEKAESAILSTENDENKKMFEFLPQDQMQVKQMPGAFAQSVSEGDGGAVPPELAGLVGGPAAPAAAAAGNASANASGNATGNGTNVTNPSEKNYEDMVNSMNWWDDTGEKTPEKLKDETSFEVKSHPVYKKMIGRFLAGDFKDKDLETWRKKTAMKTINSEEIGEEKEREGYFPNNLDHEMRDYTYGDRLTPVFHPWGWHGGPTS